MMPTSKADLVRQLLELGVEPGGTLLVHTSFSRTGPVEGGPTGLIEALRGALGPGGTLVMPSMTDDDDEPFDPAATPAIGMGIVADTFWRMAGVERSNSPHAFAAAGPTAREILAPHPVDLPHGPDSPVGRVHALAGQILLLGVGHHSNTTVHLAEFLAGVRYRRPKSARVELEDGPALVYYDEIDHCCERFALVDGWLEATGVQRRGPVGNGEARVAFASDVIDVCLGKLRENPNIFLHPRGHDVECDDAWDSMESLQPSMER